MTILLGVQSSFGPAKQSRQGRVASLPSAIQRFYLGFEGEMSATSAQVLGLALTSVKFCPLGDKIASRSQVSCPIREILSIVISITTAGN